MARDPQIGKYEVCLQQPAILVIHEQGGTVCSPLPSPLTWIWANEEASGSSSDFDGVSVGAGADAEDANVAAYSEADDDDFSEDFTACSGSCDHCGRCPYKCR
jgi:hypothetical protein